MRAVAPLALEDQEEAVSASKVAVTSQEDPNTISCKPEEASAGEPQNTTDDQPPVNSTVMSTKGTKIGSNVSLELDGQCFSGTVVSRAGKAGGKHRSWRNVRLDIPNTPETTINAFDLEKVDNLRVIEPEREENVLLTHVDFGDAKKQELKTWRDLDVFTEVDEQGQSTISSRWVLTEKEGRKKARMVTRGFEDDEIDTVDKQSTTCSKEAFRILLAMAASHNWIVNSIDIKSAFLQGERASKDIYLRPPKEVETSKIWRLNKLVYGLADASLKWYKKVRNTLLSAGCQVSSLDKALFLQFSSTNSLIGMICVHVDDFIWCDNKTFKETVIRSIRDNMNVGTSFSSCFKYLGLEIQQELDAVTLSQNDYASGIQFLDSGAVVSTKVIRGKIGQLSWLASQTRPDINFAVNVLSTRMSEMCDSLCADVNKAIKSVKCRTVSMMFPKLCLQTVYILVFSDASFGNVKNGGSQGGFIVFLADEALNLSPICWNSKRMKRVVRSTLAAEALALLEALDSATFFRQFISEMLERNTMSNSIPIKCFIDNRDLFVAISSSGNVSEKRLSAEVHFLQDASKNDNVDFAWVATKDQLADVFTKVGVQSKSLLDVIQSGRIVLPL